MEGGERAWERERGENGGQRRRLQGERKKKGVRAGVRKGGGGERGEKRKRGEYGEEEGNRDEL